MLQLRQVLVALAIVHCSGCCVTTSQREPPPPPPHLRPKPPYRAWAFHAADHTTSAGLWQN